MFILTDINEGKSYYSKSITLIQEQTPIKLRSFYRYLNDGSIYRRLREYGLILAIGDHLKSGKGGLRERKAFEE